MWESQTMATQNNHTDYFLETLRLPVARVLFVCIQKTNLIAFVNV